MYRRWVCFVRFRTDRFRIRILYSTQYFQMALVYTITHGNRSHGVQNGPMAVQYSCTVFVHVRYVLKIRLYWFQTSSRFVRRHDKTKYFQMQLDWNWKTCTRSSRDKELEAWNTYKVLKKGVTTYKIEDSILTTQPCKNNFSVEKKKDLQQMLPYFKENNAFFFF